MPSKSVARLGDATNHGGVIIEGDVLVKVNGKPMARVGDAVTCPKCNGVHIIVSGVPNIYGSNDSLTAVVGSRTSCGATIVSGSPDVFAAMPQGGGGNFEYLRGYEPRYDECFRLLDRETGKPLPGCQYVIKTESGQVITGYTDEKGYTRRVETNGAQSVEIRAGKRDGQDEVPDGVGCGNQEEGSCVDVHVRIPRLYFILYAYDAEFSFQRAAYTMQEEIENYPDFSPHRGDVIFNKGIESEHDFKQSWKKIYALSQNGMLVREGHIYSHHYVGDDYTALTALNNFADELGEELEKKGYPKPEARNEDGKLRSSEIVMLEQLNWASDSIMQIYGCRSGLPAPKTGKSTIQCFFETQPSLSTIYGQSAWTYFTDSPANHSHITPTIGGRLWPGYSGPVYLWAYWRDRNQKAFRKDPNYAKYKDNDKMDPVVLSR